MKDTLYYPIAIECNLDSGFTASFTDIPEAHACGDTFQEAFNNAIDTLGRVADVYKSKGDNLPKPSKTTGLCVPYEINKDTTFTNCCHIRNMLLRSASEVNTYTNWSDEFSRKELKDSCKHTDYTIDPTDLTESQMLSLGFMKYRRDGKGLLIPLWLLNHLCDQFEGFTISDESLVHTIKKSEMDSDNRGGLLAYGVFPKG